MLSILESKWQRSRLAFEKRKEMYSSSRWEDERTDVAKEAYSSGKAYLWVDYLGWYWIQTSAVFIFMGVLKTTSIETFVKLHDSWVCDNFLETIHIVRGIY